MKLPLLTGLVFCSLIGAQAWAKVSKHAAHETYSAVDASEEEQEEMPEVALPEPPKMIEPAKAASAPSGKTAVSHPPTQIAVVKSQPSYDPVPSEQIAPISRRLKLVDEILRKYGRAYDYRSHTVKELESILATLNSATDIPENSPEQGT